MRAGDFTDRTFYVADLEKSGEKVAGYVSYSPTLRKAVFLPIVPFRSNGYFRAVIKTDVKDADGKITEAGVHDLAGNALDIAVIWTFRTKESPNEAVWSLNFSVTDGTSTDANNIAGVKLGAQDGKDPYDMRTVGSLPGRLQISFLGEDGTQYDRDVRPADGRLSHH
jgi:hypothetical protein